MMTGGAAHQHAFTQAREVPLEVSRAAGTIHVAISVAGVHFRALVDSGSARTWLPAEGCVWTGYSARRHAGLRLAGGGGAECRPTGQNYSHRYADGSKVLGTLCMASLKVGAVTVRQQIGAPLLDLFHMLATAYGVSRLPATSSMGCAVAQERRYSSPMASPATSPLCKPRSASSSSTSRSGLTCAAGRVTRHHFMWGTITGGQPLQSSAELSRPS